VSWVRIDDKAWSHPKFASLPAGAVRLWMFALCWCNQQESDGFVPRSMLRVLRGTTSDASALVASCLWVESEDGWRFHDYLQYQPSRDQLTAQRTSTKERVTRFRERSRNAVTPPVTPTGNAVTNAPVTLPPTQPNPTQPEREEIREAGKPPPRPKLVRWRRVPADGEPSAAHRELATSLVVDIERQLVLFRDHEFKDPKSDADAAFRTWLRRAGEYRAPMPGGKPPPGSNFDRLKARAERFEAEERQLLIGASNAAK
jgi:hypothetical protein